MGQIGTFEYWAHSKLNTGTSMNIGTSSNKFWIKPHLNHQGNTQLLLKKSFRKCYWHSRIKLDAMRAQKLRQTAMHKSTQSKIYIFTHTTLDNLQFNSRDVTSWVSERIFHETESSNWKVLLAQYPGGNSSVRVSPQAKTETPGQSITKGSSFPHNVPPPSDASTLLPHVIFPCTFPLLVLSIQELGSVLSISVHLPSSHKPPPTCSHLPQCQISSYSHTQANGSYTRSLLLDGTGAFCAIRSLWRS